MYTMTLSKEIIDSLERIGATIPKVEGSTPIHILVHEVIWPDIAYEGSTERMRKLLIDQGRIDAENWSDETVRDETPSLFEFTFLPSDSRGSFWDGWERDFPLVDSSMLFPIASDEYHFYFIGGNPDDDTDPLVYSVDHEETDQEPYQRQGLTVSRLLLVLEAVNP
jgi:hypothetical protein